MKLKDVLLRMTAWYEADMSVHVEGPIGIGKTSVMMQAPKIVGETLNRNLGVVYLNGTTIMDVDLLGFGLPKHYDTHSEMIFSKPFYWRTTEGKLLEDYDGGMIFVDEADKLSQESRKALTEGRLSGRIGPHHLPRTEKGKWLVWSAGNRDEDRSGSTKKFDHDINRTTIIPIEHDPKGWQDWADENALMGVTKSFAHNFKEIVFSSTVPKKQEPFCTPRSLAKLDRYTQVLMLANGGHLPDDSLYLEEAQGTIGAAPAQQWLAHCRLQLELPNVETIVGNPEGTPVPTAPDAMLLLCWHLAHEVEKENAGPIITYIKRFPKEFAITFVKSACQRQPKLIFVPEFKKWSDSNASLLASVAALRTKAS